MPRFSEKVNIVLKKFDCDQCIWYLGVEEI